MDSQQADELQRFSQWTIQAVQSMDMGTNKGLRQAVVFVEGEAKKNAVQRIYSQTIPLGKNGKPLYKRTGLYKASIRGLIINKDTGCVTSPVAYAKKLEYFYNKMCLTDAVFNNKIKIENYIANGIADELKGGGTP